MIRRALFALGLTLLAACNRGSSGPSLRLSQPSAVAVFFGYTDRHASRWPYAAVANSAQDELILFDAVNDEVVAAPILLRPLSIPVGAPRPALLASADFIRPDGNAPARPSLMVVVTAGSTELQLIRTWRDPVMTGPGLAGEPLDLGSEILAIAATPVVTSAGTEVPDRVRVVATLAGGDVAVVEYQWTGDPDVVSGSDAGGVASVGPVTRRAVGFEGVSLAVDPKDHRYAYAATLDVIPPGIQGVAQIDVSGTTPPLTAVAIDAKAPTRLVAAFTLRERVLDARGAYDQYTFPSSADAPSAFQTTEVPRVYAWRDPGACGPKTDVACGIAVLDPVTRDVLEDPWNQGASPKRYLPPITLPSRPVAMVVGPPAAHPPATDNAGGPPADLMLINPINPRLTTGVLLLPSEDGRSYFADLARWETPSGVYELSSTSGTGASSFRPSATLVPRIGFYPKGAPGAEPDFTANATSSFQLTPGFTPSDQWSVTFQGYLPDFAASRVVKVEDATGGNYRVSFQLKPPGSSTLTQVVNVHDPARGVRVGDIVEFWTDAAIDDTPAKNTPHCPDTTLNPQVDMSPVEGKIVSIDAPDQDHPGGSVVVQRGDCVPVAQGPTTECDSKTHGPWDSMPECWSEKLAGTRQARIRAGSGTPGAEEFVVVGASTGYAGRAVSTPVSPGDSGPSFAFTNAEEAALVQQCAALAGADPACTGACRSTCEEAAIARRARRIHLTSVACYTNPSSPSDSFCSANFPDFVKPQDASTAFPPPEGPVLAFSVGWRDLSGATPARLLVRDTKVTFNTRSGWVPSSRFGGGGNSGPSTQPTGAAYFDRTEETSWNRVDERYRFFVSHVGNVVLDLSPARDNNNTRVLR